MGKPLISRELRRRRVRKQKLHKLRKRLSSAQGQIEQKKIWHIAQKVAPWLSFEEFQAGASKQTRK